MARPNPDLEAYIGMYERHGWVLVSNTETAADFERDRKGYPGIGWWIVALFLPIMLVPVGIWAILARMGRFERHQYLHVEVNSEGEIVNKKQWHEPATPSN